MTASFPSTIALTLVGMAACSAQDQLPSETDDSTSSPGSGSEGPDAQDGLSVPAGEGMGGSTTKPPATLVEALPPGFTAATGAASGDDAEQLRGGWKYLAPLAEIDPPDDNTCANVLRVLVRDFDTYEHPDFGGPKEPEEAPGMVEPLLGLDRKPVRNDAYPDVAVQFEEWYANVEGTNTSHAVDLWLEPLGDSFVLDSSRFFPLEELETDEAKHGNSDGELRNFGFTTELHTAFEYQGGEVFTFRGDDDVFVFIDGQLVVDLGGVHAPLEGSVEIDSLGLTLGEVYDFDLFQAERNPAGSNFRLETSLDFTECGQILPSDVIK